MGAGVPRLRTVVQSIYGQSLRDQSLRSGVEGRAEIQFGFLHRGDQSLAQQRRGKDRILTALEDQPPRGV